MQTDSSSEQSLNSRERKKSVDFAGDTFAFDTHIGRNARTAKWVPVFGFYVYWQRCAKSRHTAYARILHGTIFFLFPPTFAPFSIVVSLAHTLFRPIVLALLTKWYEMCIKSSEKHKFAKAKE